MIYQIENQLSVKLENAPGSIASVSQILSEQNIDMNAISLNDGENSGYFRFTACDFQAARRALQTAGYEVTIDEVLSIRLKDSKGKLAELTKAFFRSGINIDYMYASVDQQGSESRLILKVSNIHMAAHVIDEMKIAA